MPVFEYKVARSNGSTLQGQVEGENENMARSHLEGQGFLVFHLRRQDAWAGVSIGSLGSRGKIPLQEFMIFNQELLALIKAGLPILRVWDLLIERARPGGFQSVLGLVRQDIRGGAATSEALANHPQHFPELYVATMKAGEQSGNLSEVLQRYIQHLKLMIGLRQKLVKALAYPTFLVLASVGLMAVFILFVIPTFMEVYQGTARELPIPTQILIHVVDNMQAYLLPSSSLVILLGLAGWLWYRTPRGTITLDRVVLRIPVVGEYLRKHHAIQFTRTLATVLSGGIPLVEALRIAKGSFSNRYLVTGLGKAITQVREGAPLAASLGQHNILPKLALEMVSVGEETGSLETMLRDVAEFFETEMDFRLNQMTTWIETGLLLAMGVVIGTVLIVMYLPIFEMAGG